MMGLIATGSYAANKRRAQLQAERALLQELEDELETARQMQMGLMPTQSPQISGLDIAGRCQTVNHVGGDFFQYFEGDKTLSICLADVTGHAMEAAVPVMMFSGILKTEIRHDASVQQLFSTLNNTLYDALENRTFICFAMGELNVDNRTMRLANGGCPYPYHYRAATGEITELQVDAYPLGVRAQTAYSVIETALGPGDYVIFCSDGIVETTNEQKDLFGFERAAETIRTGCTDGLSSEALIDRIIGSVQSFAGNEPQGDDMTCIVLRIET